MSENKIKLSFFGGAGQVTGANYLLEGSPDARSGRATKLLVDCGLFQGSKINEDKNDDPFPYDPSSVGALVVTHAHLDHIGRVPKLIKDGFKGKIFSNPATKDFAELMLTDSLGVLRKEARRNGRRELFFGEEDIKKAMEQWVAVEYLEEFDAGGFKVRLRESGHILGASMVEITLNGKKIVFTGDLGNPPNPLLRDTDYVTDADFLVMESTYGDKEHEDLDEARLRIERIIEDTINAGGVLMIPAFSLERTQKLLFEINNLVENGRIPKVPVFLDSPLAIKATEVYKKYERYYNDKAKGIISSGDALFHFPGFKLTLATEESKAINDVPSPKIIIAGSGMSNGGRIIHHERRYLSDPNSTILLMGYQSVGSLGRRIQEGARVVTILGNDVSVNAKVENIRGYSAHPDMNELFELVKKTSDTLKKVFLVQGEQKSAAFIAQRIKDYLGIKAFVPQYGDSFEIDV